MIEELISKINQAKTPAEILSYKPIIMDRYNDLGNKICNQNCSILNYEEIKMLHELNSPMMAYYGSSFFDKCGIPFLKEHNSNTIDIIEMAILFYSLQICELLKCGLLSKEMDRLNNLSEQDLFWKIWYYFKEIITCNNDTRQITVPYENETEEFYVTDEYYEKIIDLTFASYKNSKFMCIINRILGIYKIRFSKMMYVIDYQPLFVEVGYMYLNAIV